MNDIFVTTFILLALTFFYKFISKKSFSPKSLYLTGIFTGLSLATKHSGILLYPIFLFFLTPRLISLIKKPKKLGITFYSLIIVPLAIYFLSYSQFFLQGQSIKTFIELHQQIYWYQTNLSATHDYQSTAWQWPLLIRPVWFHVKYFPTKIANIYNLGNPTIFWGGLIAALYLIVTKFKKNLYPLVSYIFLFFPFILSPRIMFLHHYLPTLPFLSYLIAKSIYKNKHLTTYYLILAVLLFLFFYPINTAIPLDKDLLKIWFWLPTWR